MTERWTVNSEKTKDSYKAQIDKWFDEHRYLTFDKPRIGPDRSLDQNALFHMWATEYAGYLLRKDKRSVDSGELDGMKRILKKQFYTFSGEPWLIHKVVDPFSGNSKADFTSSAKWKRGEMFMFLEWLQSSAADRGLILESKGEYAKLQREQNK